MSVDFIELDGLLWPLGSSARMWFCQPRVQLTADAPFRPTNGANSLDLLRAVLDLDHNMGAPGDGAPSVIVLPELSVSPTDMDAVRALILAARANTLFVLGVGHMSAAEIDAVEPSAHLCGEPIAGRYANCAVIGCGGSNQVFLQPKVVASKEELDCHWPGLVVRYFNARHFSFVVFICSEMLDRAQAKTTIRAVLDELSEKNRQLSAMFWLQHNPRPRAIDFSQSLTEISRLEHPTLFVVGTRNAHPPRLENFAVSGAVFKKNTLSSHFNVLTRQFHYAEPVPEADALSRFVLLRYDVDVNLVDTALASAIQDEDRTPRSQLFGRVVPFMLGAGGLVSSDENVHLSEIMTRSRDMAAATAVAQTARINSLAEQLVALGTRKFQEFLDLAILPRPENDAVRHAGGQPHPDGDYSCRCWIHRQCIDRLCDEDVAAEPVAQLLLALAGFAASGLNVDLGSPDDSLANVRLSSAGDHIDVCIVYPFDFNADATEAAIRGGGRARLSEPGYIVLGTSGRAGRPAIAGISQAVAVPLAPLQAGNATEPLLRVIYNDELAVHVQRGDLPQLLQERFGVA